MKPPVLLDPLDGSDPKKKGGGAGLLDPPDETKNPPKPPGTQGGGTATLAPPATARGRDWAALRQFSVFLQNHVGNLADLTRTLEDADLAVAALSIQEACDHAVIRFVVDDYERAHDLLELSDFETFETDVIGVELPDTARPMTDACRSLLRAEIDIHYAYALTLPGTARGGLILYVDDVDGALDALHRGGEEVVTEQNLKDRFAE